MDAGGLVFWVYILQSDAGQFYVGSTDDLVARLARHNSPAASGRRYTARHGPWKLVWSEVHESRSSAIRREREIKRMKSSRWIKEQLLAASSDDPVGRVPT